MKQLKEKISRKVLRTFVKAKVALESKAAAEKNLEQGISFVQVFVIGALVLAVLILVFKGPITDWINATVDSWFKAGGEVRPE